MSFADDDLAAIGGALRTAFEGNNDMPAATATQRAIEMQEMREFVIEQDKLTEERIMARLTRLILVQVLGIAGPILIAVWQLSAINATGAASLDLLKSQQAELARRGKWMQERERWEDSVEMWARPKGYAPPRYRAPMAATIAEQDDAAAR